MSLVPHPWKSLNKLCLRVTPKASSNRVKAEEAGGEWLIRVYVTVPPENGKANEAVIKLLAKEMELPKSAFSIIKGAGDRDKIVVIKR